MPKKTTKVAKKKIQELLKKSREKKPVTKARLDKTIKSVVESPNKSAERAALWKRLQDKRSSLFETQVDKKEYGGVLQDMTGGVNQDPRFDIYNTGQFGEAGMVVEYADPAAKVTPLLAKMADGGISDRYTAEVGDEEIAVMVKGKEKKGYPVYARLSGYSPMTVGVYPTKEAAEKKASELRKRNKMEYGGALQDMTGGVNSDPRFDIYNTGQFADKGAVIESITGGSHAAVNPVVGYADGGDTPQEKDALQEKIEKILKDELPNFYTFVRKRKNFIGETYYLQIGMAASNYEINRVSGQYPQYVSLMLDLSDMDLHTQVFGGNGGDRIYLIPDKNDPKEKYLAMAGRRIPFRKPKPNEKNILDAIRRFAQNYRNTLLENRQRLMYQDVVNYDEVLGMAYGGPTEWNIELFEGGGDTELPFKKKIKLGKVAYGSKAKNKPVEITVELKRKPLATNWDTLDREKDVVVFSMMGGIWNASHNDMISGGQNLDTIAKLMPGNKDLQELIGYWKKYHLNDMKAGTKRQTEAVEKWKARGGYKIYDYPATVEHLKSIELDEDKGYKYGHGWLYEPIPDDVVSRIIELANKLDRDSYAMGGALEHGLMKGDHVLLIKDDYIGVVNENTGKSAVINISTGERTEVKEMEEMAGGGISAAYRPDKIKNDKAREYTENFIPFVGNNLSGMAFPNGDYLVSSYGYYPIWYYKKSEEKWYGNKDKFSVTTAKHISQSRPTYDANMVSNDQMSEVIASAQEGDQFKRYGGPLK